MYMKEKGPKEAPAIIFIHGGGVSGWMWSNQMEYFAYKCETRWHCIAPDLPEQGRSGSETRFSIKGSTDELAAYIRENIPGGRAHIVGLSIGAQIAVDMINRTPDVVDHAVIISALVRKMPLTRALIGPSLKLSMPMVKHREFSKLQAKELGIPDEYFESYYNEAMKLKADALARIMKDNLNFSLPGSLRNRQTRTLVLLGDTEKKIMQRSAADLLKALPNSRGFIVKQAGHCIPLTEPDLCNRTIEAWLRGTELPGELAELKRS